MFDHQLTCGGAGVDGGKGVFLFSGFLPFFIFLFLVPVARVYSRSLDIFSYIFFIFFFSSSLTCPSPPSHSISDLSPDTHTHVRDTCPREGVGGASPDGRSRRRVRKRVVVARRPRDLGQVTGLERACFTHDA